jgi:hypothetical protein
VTVQNTNFEVADEQGRWMVRAERWNPALYVNLPKDTWVLTVNLPHELRSGGDGAHWVITGESRARAAAEVLAEWALHWHSKVKTLKDQFQRNREGFLFEGQISPTPMVRAAAPANG